MHIKDVLKLVRRKSMLFQKELAYKLGVSRGAISHYELGMRVPKAPVMRKLVKLAKDYNVEIDWENIEYK